jgi:outer membrane autotransporter protein
VAAGSTVTASAPNGEAVGIRVGIRSSGLVSPASFPDGITNTGSITASGKTGIGILSATPIQGGFRNTGTVIGSTAAIDLTPEAGGSTVINQEAGALIGDVKLSANADVLNFTGGTIVNAVTAPSGSQDVVNISGQNATFASTASVNGVSAFTIAPGSRLTLQVTATQAPSINAHAITLGGTLVLSPQGSLFTFAIAHSTSFKDVFVADPPLSGSFAAVTTTAPLFTASVSPDATTPNALDATLTLSETALAVSAQDLTQDGRLGLDAPRVLTQAVQDRLVANGGALGEGATAGQKGVEGLSFGNANIWARGADQFGTATVPASSTGVGYDINRAAPLIAGIDWRLDNGIVAGVAATYVATSAKFKDGSSTNVSSYQGAAYAGWAGGPWYAFGSAVVSFNEFGTSRLLTPFGLPGDATSSPSGQSYQGHAEAGYHWGLPAAGVNLSVTPCAALDYVYAQTQGFSETGGFGALSVNAADANSFQTTFGVRLTSRIGIANYGTLIPELRLGWNHEFLDASQKITAALVGVPGSTFTSTGILFGRDAVLIGAGLSLELSPDAKVFVDYDGRLGSRLQEHSVSGGLRVRF